MWSSIQAYEPVAQGGLIAIGLVAVALLMLSLVQRRRRTKHRLATTDLKRRLDGPEDILVLDVRDRADYAGEGGHIPGAKNIPLREMQSRLSELAAWKQRPLAVVCTTNVKSGRAANLLRKSGFGRVLLVADGMLGWSVNGFETE